MAVRELIFAVDSLHMQGIVHGAISSGNVIVSPTGAVRRRTSAPFFMTMLPSMCRRLPICWNRSWNNVASRRRRWAATFPRDSASGYPCASGVPASPRSMNPGRWTIQQPMSRNILTARGRRNLWAAVVVMVIGVAVACAAWFAAEDGYLSIPRSFHIPQIHGGK